MFDQVSGNSIRFGAATSLTGFINKLKANQDLQGFHYLAALVKHYKVVANVMVRNVSTASLVINWNIVLYHIFFTEHFVKNI